MPAYIGRSLEPVLRSAAAQFPAVVLTGPRQAGKRTLLRHVFPAARRAYVSLDLPDTQAAARADPRGFLDLYPPPAILDEIQAAPELLPYLRDRIDRARDRPGQYLLTGSQNLQLAARVTESLAGRAAMLDLLPLTWREVAGDPLADLPWERPAPARTRRTAGPDPLPPRDLFALFLRGGYPEPVVRRDLDSHRWHDSYIRTYLERDVRGLRQIGDLTQFQLFVRALAARSAQLLNLSDLARDLGVAVNTIKAWLSVLEATFQVIVLRPYHANLNRRLVKTPKVYLADVGLLCHLVGLRDPTHALQGPLGGAILETAVVVEVVRRLRHAGRTPEVYFWRTATGSEVDLLVATERGLVPIEVKLSATPRPAMTTTIRALREDLGERLLPGYVVHPGSVVLPLGAGVTALPFAQL